MYISLYTFVQAAVKPARRLFQPVNDLLTAVTALVHEQHSIGNAVQAALQNLGAVGLDSTGAYELGQPRQELSRVLFVLRARGEKTSPKP